MIIETMDEAEICEVLAKREGLGFLLIRAWYKKDAKVICDEFTNAGSDRAQYLWKYIEYEINAKRRKEKGLGW
jgi:hypothetical protein